MTAVKENPTTARKSAIFGRLSTHSSHRAAALAALAEGKALSILADLD